jgi:hypothetical protein
MHGAPSSAAATASTAAVASPSVQASIVTQPVGLAPGTQYRIVFVTDNSYAPSDTNIADYNADVTSEANNVAALKSLNTTWSAIMATPTTPSNEYYGRRRIRRAHLQSGRARSRVLLRQPMERAGKDRYLRDHPTGKYLLRLRLDQ